MRTAPIKSKLDDYHKWEGLVINFTREYAGKNNWIDWDEMYGETRLACLEALESYNPLKSENKSCWMYNRIKNHLIDYCKKMVFRKHDSIYDNIEEEEIELPQDYSSIDPERATIFKSEFETLSDEAKEIAKILWSAPTKVLEITNLHSAWAIRGSIIQYALNTLGWSQVKTYKTINELKAFVA